MSETKLPATNAALEMRKLTNLISKPYQSGDHEGWCLAIEKVQSTLTVLKQALIDEKNKEPSIYETKNLKSV